MGACLVLPTNETIRLNPPDVRWILAGHTLPRPGNEVSIGTIRSTMLIDRELYAMLIGHLQSAVDEFDWIERISLIALNMADGSGALALGTRVTEARYLEAAIQVVETVAGLKQPTPFPVHDFYIAGREPSGSTDSMIRRRSWQRRSTESTAVAIPQTEQRPEGRR